MKPKVHKCKSIIDKIQEDPAEIINMNGAPDLIGRPIIAGINSQTRHLSDLIGKILSPIVKEQITYIKDDWDYVHKLPSEIKY